MFFRHRVLAVRVCVVIDGFVWALGIVYCPECAVGKRWVFRSIWLNIKSLWPIPWIFGGDFSMVIYPLKRTVRHPLLVRWSFSLISSMLMRWLICHFKGGGPPGPTIESSRLWVKLTGFYSLRSGMSVLLVSFWWHSRGVFWIIALSSWVLTLLIVGLGLFDSRTAGYIMRTF